MNSDEAFLAAERDFGECLSRFKDELASSAGDASAFLDASRLAWLRLCALAPADAGLPENFYLVHTFGAAVEVQRPDEAARLYQLTPPELRARVDSLEAGNPGCVKIWLSKP